MSHEIISHLKSLKLRGMAHSWPELVAQARMSGFEPEHFMMELIRSEAAERKVRSIAYQMGAARFPAHRDFNGFNFAESRADESLLRSLQTMAFLDAAHNLEGARNLALALRDIYSFRHLILLVGILADKERGKMIDYLGPFGDQVIVTRPNNPRAGDFRGVARYFQPYKGEVMLEEDPEKALALGLSLTEPEDLLCITGSIYMLKEIRRLLKEDQV